MENLVHFIDTLVHFIGFQVHFIVNFIVDSDNYQRSDRKFTLDSTNVNSDDDDVDDDDDE